MEGWYIGCATVTKRKDREEGSTPSPSTNAEGRIEIIPVSRQKHLLRSLRRYSSQGASLYVYRIETASKETDKLKEWKETVPNP